MASVDLCSVAAGRLDGFYERGLNYWDYAAGALIAAEAGAVVGGLHGAPPSAHASDDRSAARAPGLIRATPGPRAGTLADLRPPSATGDP